MQTFRPFEVSSAPEAPGIYAWYAAPRIGAADVQSPDMLSRIARRHVEQLAPVHLDVQASAPFGAAWGGKLVAEREQLDLTGLDQLGRQDRELFADAFMRTAILCGSPLYVGMTINQTLRDRLAQHVAELQADNERGGTSKFAARAREAGFGEDQLVVVAIPIGADHPTAQRATVITTLERVLNRAAKPLLGRR